MAVYIILAVLILIGLVALLLFTVNVKVGLRYSTVSGNFTADASVLFVRIPLHPQKSTKSNKPKKKKSDSKAARNRKKIKDNLETAAKKGREAAETQSKQTLSQKASNLAGLIKHLCISLRELAPGIIDATTLDIKKLDVCVGAEDAADAAVNYGLICGGVEMLMAFEHECKKLVVSGYPYITVDYLSPKIQAEFELVLTVRAYKVLVALYRAEDAYYTYRAGI